MIDKACRDGRHGDCEGIAAHPNRCDCQHAGTPYAVKATGRTPAAYHPVTVGRAAPGDLPARLPDPEAAGRAADVPEPDPAAQLLPAGADTAAPR
jgi:hypothetical protein